MARPESDMADNAAMPLWGPPSEVVTGTTYAGPHCARLNDVDWVVWSTRFYDDISDIWYTYLSDGVWFNPQRLGVQTTSAPAVAAFHDEIHVVWRNASDNNVMWSVFDGNGWSDPRIIAGAFTSDTPALAACDGRLYLAWSTAATSPGLTFAWYDGTEWSVPQQAGFSISYGPALASVGNTLYCAFCISKGGPVFHCQLSSGGVEGAATLGIPTDATPALASDGGQLWTAWKVTGGSSVMVAAGTPATGLSTQALLSSARTSAPPGLCGSPSGIRAVWQDSYTAGIYTAITLNVETIENNVIAGRAGPGNYICLTVDTGEGRVFHYSTRTDTAGTWSVKIDTNLASGTTLSATAALDQDGMPSDAFVVVLGTYQPGSLFISSVTDTVQGKAPLAGQIIKGWRSSDGQLVVNYPVPPPIDLYDGTDFTARFLPSMSLEEGDMLNLVSQFPDSGTMTPFVSKQQGYMVTTS